MTSRDVNITANGAVSLPKPCCARIPDEGGWCVLPDHHDGEHIGYPNAEPVAHNEFGPKHSVQRRW